MRLRRFSGLENTKPRRGSGALRIRRLVWVWGQGVEGVEHDLIGNTGGQLYEGVPHREPVVFVGWCCKNALVRSPGFLKALPGRRRGLFFVQRTNSTSASRTT
jgi:hypothetical protein